MKTDLDRWVDLEGPPPEGVCELLDAVVPPMTAEHAARLDAKVFAAVAADRRRAARRRALAWVAATSGALAVLAASGGGAVVVAHRLQRSTVRAAARIAPAPASPVVHEAPDAGAPRR
jgi:hypothetical protein